MATGAPRAYTALEDALADDAVEAVYVSTTNEQHAAQAIACLRAGRHVLCEKPIALSIDDADAMIAAAHKARRMLAVNHHLRASERLDRLRSQVAEGAIGAPRLIRAVHRCHVRPERRGNWRFTDRARGAGAILDLTVHTADAIRFVSGSEIVSVRGHAAPAHADKHPYGAHVQESWSGIETAVAGTMRLEQDVLVAFADSYSPLPAHTAIEVHGDEGTLEARGLFGDEDPYAPSVERFAAGRPVATAEDGRAALAVALALRAGLEAPQP